MNNYTVLILLSIAVLLSVSCATDPVRPDEGTIIRESITAGNTHEDCMKVMPGGQIAYWFESSMPLDFNLHYHDDSGVMYPVREDGVSKGSKTYTAEIEQYYCLMWTNPHSGDVSLSYTSEAR